MTFTVIVQEAAATPDTIQFKLVLEADGESETTLPSTTLFRTFQQISWVYHGLKGAFPDIVLPPLPEKPTPSFIDDQDYVEKKRLQMERFFNRITSRAELTRHKDFLHFLSNDMSPTEVGPTMNTGVLSFLKFNRVIMKSNSDRGFKSFKPNEMIEGNEQDVFHKHQIYILLQESYFGFIAETLNQLIHTREGLGEELTHMGDLVIETTQSKYRLGVGLKSDLRDSQRHLDRKMQMLGLLMDELSFIFTRQGKEENMKFGDVMIEYKNSFDPLKIVFNVRTIKLMEYVDHLKQRNKKRDKSDRLKLKLRINHPELSKTIKEEEEATILLKKSKEEFDECQNKVKKEIKMFEMQKNRDLRKTIRDYVNVSLHYEKLKLQHLEKTLVDIQQINLINKASSIPIPFKKADTTNSDNSSSSSKQKKRKPLYHEHKELKKKPLQSSTSLPTTANNQHELYNNIQYSTETRNVARMYMSASFDGRLTSSKDCPLTSYNRNKE
ncbi:MAG: hypothetical protein EXX96DRAFT_544902 [Benjaminiella poitrasii]|nr:MAG: hypothetical protein EXX96DRAFT_544902 [Benjaminiella poitrasii]